MPPNDTLFDTQSPTETPQADAPAVETPAAPTPLTAEQVQALVAERTAPVTQQLSALQRENDALKLAIQQSQQQQPTQAPVADDFVSRFNTDPSGAIREIAQRESSEGLKQLAPHLNTLISSANEAFLGAQQTRIEQEFGPKAWTEVFQPALTENFATLRRQNPFAIADIKLVQREVDTITGQQFNKLIALRDEHQKGRSASEQANIERIAAEARRGITTNLTGGIRANPKGGTPDLDPAQREALAHYNRVTGQNKSPAEYAQQLVAAQNSNSIDEWLAHQKPAGRA